MNLSVLSMSSPSMAAQPSVLQGRGISAGSGACSIWTQAAVLSGRPLASRFSTSYSVHPRRALGTSRRVEAKGTQTVTSTKAPASSGGGGNFFTQLLESASSALSQISGGGGKTNEKTSEIVDELLEAIEATDRGAGASAEEKEQIASLVQQLIEIGTPRILKSPILFDEYDVVYTSSPTAAGGGFRSGIGRAIFRTTAMQQNLYKPDVAFNCVKFRLFGFIPGQVYLKGVFYPKDGNSSGDTVIIDFEPPYLDLAGFKELRFAKESQVTISLKYLDERVRIGVGSRGSIFVFRRIVPDIDEEEEEEE